jgi:cellulose biosynthesis protein BcsQ
VHFFPLSLSHRAHWTSEVNVIMAAMRSSSSLSILSPASASFPTVKHDATIIGSYNHKGGVTKTTFLINLAHGLVRKGYRVLLVDADPQCNLTNHYLNDRELISDDDQDDERDEKELAEKQDDVHIDDENNDEMVSQDVDEADDCSVAVDEKEEVRLLSLKQVSCPALHENAELPPDSILQAGEFTQNLYTALIQDIVPFAAIPLRPEGVREGHLFLIPGAPNLSLLEGRIDERNFVNFPEMGIKLLGGFRKLVKETAGQAAVNAPIVLVDFSPSDGSINQLLATSCDALIPTCYADFYSISSSESLLFNVLPKWAEWHANKVKLAKDQRRLKLHPALPELWKNYRPNEQMPRLMPFIPSRHQIRKNKNGQVHVVQGPSGWILALQRIVLGAGSRGPVPPVVRDMYLPFGTEMVLPLIPDMGAIVQLCHDRQTGFDGVNEPALLRKRFGHSRAVNGYRQRLTMVTTAFDSIAMNVVRFHEFRNGRLHYGITVARDGQQPEFVGPPDPTPPPNAGPGRGRSARRGRDQGRAGRPGGFAAAARAQAMRGVNEDQKSHQRGRGNKRARGS